MVTVLIVDDSRTSRRFLRNMLTEAGYEVVAEAVDGEDGMKKYEEFKPDIVTMDITMPKLDGIDAVSLSEDGKDKVELIQPEIPHESYLSTYVTALDLCLQGLISPSTLGIDVKKLDNAEAQREKEKATLYTRNKIVETIQHSLPEVVNTAIQTYEVLTRQAVTCHTVEIPFGEYANPSFESQVETVSKGKQGGIMSIEASVEELYGDSKDEEWKKQEVSRLKAEQGIETMEQVSVSEDNGGFVVDKVQDIPK